MSMSEFSRLPCSSFPPTALILPLPPTPLCLPCLSLLFLFSSLLSLFSLPLYSSFPLLSLSLSLSLKWPLLVIRYSSMAAAGEKTWNYSHFLDPSRIAPNSSFFQYVGILHRPKITKKCIFGRGTSIFDQFQGLSLIFLRGGGCNELPSLVMPLFAIVHM